MYEFFLACISNRVAWLAPTFYLALILPSSAARPVEERFRLNSHSGAFRLSFCHYMICENARSVVCPSTCDDWGHHTQTHTRMFVLFLYYIRVISRRLFSSPPFQYEEGVGVNINFPPHTHTRPLNQSTHTQAHNAHMSACVCIIFMLRPSTRPK